MGTINAVYTFLPGMKSHSKGRICIISSVGGQIGLWGMSHYCATKFALKGLTEVSSTPEIRMKFIQNSGNSNGTIWYEYSCNDCLSTRHANSGLWGREQNQGLSFYFLSELKKYIACCCKSYSRTWRHRRTVNHVWSFDRCCWNRTGWFFCWYWWLVLLKVSDVIEPIRRQNVLVTFLSCWQISHLGPSLIQQCWIS